MLPDESGYDIIKKLRLNSATKRLPVIMVTAKSTELDMIKGLEDGADDYIKKPFSVMELITRVKALLRRTETDEAGVLDVGEIELNHDSLLFISFADFAILIAWSDILSKSLMQ